MTARFISRRSFLAAMSALAPAVGFGVRVPAVGFGVRVPALGFAVLGLSELISGCRRVTPPLRIATNPWVGYEFMFLAMNEGWISPAEIDLVDAGSATASLDLLAAGKVDGAALTLDEMLRGRERGFALRAVLVFDVSLGADVLFAKPGIETLAQLKGKRIGFEPSGVGALMLHRILEAAALSHADVIRIPATIDRHQEIWRSGKVDALITFEPVASLLQAEDARPLFDSSMIPDTIVDVLAVTPAAVEHHHATLHRLVAAHFRSLRKFRKNPNDAAYRMAERLKLSPKEVIGAFRGLELPAESRNRKMLRGENSIIINTARELSTIMVQAGILKNGQSDLANLVSTDFIPREEAR